MSGKITGMTTMAMNDTDVDHIFDNNGLDCSSIFVRNWSHKIIDIFFAKLFCIF